APGRRRQRQGAGLLLAQSRPPHPGLLPGSDPLRPPRRLRAPDRTAHPLAPPGVNPSPAPALPPGGDAAAEPLRRELRGVVERITYQNPENGYTIARLAPERSSGDTRAIREQASDYLVTLVGTLADLSPGEAIA